MTLAEHTAHDDLYARIDHLNVPDLDGEKVVGDPENEHLAAAQREFGDKIAGQTGWLIKPSTEEEEMRMIFGGVVAFEPDEPFEAIPEGLEEGGAEGEGNGRILLMHDEVEVLPLPTEETH